ncbi:MAG: CHAD domain-containing protein [Campylobacterota bacterium]|nr:CHAD domain-containing protein [Campylobacterota bacterium]
MNEEIIKRKLENINEMVSKMVLLNLDKIDEKRIHRLRIAARELLSLIQHDTPLYQKIKKLIKKSNKIRDIDVFLSYFLAIIEDKHIKRSTIEYIKNSMNSKRMKRIKKFYKSIEKLSLQTDNIKIVDHSQEQIDTMHQPSINIDTLSLDQKSLHKFRIDMKKLLYIYRNHYPHKIKKIKKLKRIKDRLGFINDNYNGLMLLEEHLGRSLNLTTIEKIIMQCNHKHLGAIKKLYKSL